MTGGKKILTNFTEEQRNEATDLSKETGVTLVQNINTQGFVMVLQVLKRGYLAIHNQEYDDLSKDETYHTLQFKWSDLETDLKLEDFSDYEAIATINKDKQR